MTVCKITLFKSVYWYWPYTQCKEGRLGQPQKAYCFILTITVVYWFSHLYSVSNVSILPGKLTTAANSLLRNNQHGILRCSWLIAPSGLKTRISERQQCLCSHLERPRAARNWSASWKPIRFHILAERGIWRTISKRIRDGTKQLRAKMSSPPLSTGIGMIHTRGRSRAKLKCKFVLFCV